MQTQELAGSTALVTGATSGIGRAAESLASRGAHVLVVGRDHIRGEAVVESIRSAGGKADFVQADLHDATSAAEFGPQGVRVNAVSPGPTRTPGVEFMGEALDQLAAQGPAGRVADPAEIAAAITYLVSEEASFVHGTVLSVDGGRTAV